MHILPAIDIKDGRVVRLYQGRFDRLTDYGDDPVAVARHWVSLGAAYLHVVDLDGAQSGERRNREIIRAIAAAVPVPVETGGGIRDAAAAAELLSDGVARVILGTRAVDDRDFFGDMLTRWGAERVAVSLDCSNGFAARRGWQEVSTVRGADLARDLAARGLKYLVYTDISRDGALTGPDIDGLKEMLAVPGLSVISSGGVKSLDDIRALGALRAPNLWGVITGRAIYEGTLDLAAALELVRKPAGKTGPSMKGVSAC